MMWMIQWKRSPVSPSGNDERPAPTAVQRGVHRRCWAVGGKTADQVRASHARTLHVWLSALPRFLTLQLVAVVAAAVLLLEHEFL